MNILFIHGNYPGQFRHLAVALQRTGNRVVFLTERKVPKDQQIQGIEIRNFKVHRSANDATHHYLIATEESILKGQAVLRSIEEMLREGFKPGLVITHGGVGLGMFIKDILPESIHIGLFEWFFQHTTAKWLLKEFRLNEQLQTKTRNLPILQELTNCDIGVVPTEWQKTQFPKEFLFKLRVVFDGIDTEFFKNDSTVDINKVLLIGENLSKPLEIEPETKILSYATRGMETLRGFPEFIRTASKALQEDDKLKVVIAGRDRCAYSYKASTHKGSWKDAMMEEVGDSQKTRIHFTGLMPYIHYRTLLQRSTVHCYFTRPYVTSWSLFEAAACGARLCINSGNSTENIVEDAGKVAWVNLDNQNNIDKAILKHLKDENRLERSSLKDEYKIQHCLGKWEAIINECIVRG